MKPRAPHPLSRLIPPSDPRAARRCRWATPVGTVLALHAAQSAACDTCRALVDGAVYGDGFLATLAMLLLPLALLVALGLGLHRSDGTPPERSPRRSDP